MIKIICLAIKIKIMLLFLFYTFGLVLICEATAQSQFASFDLTAYPQEYETLTISDWDAVVQKLNKLFSYKTLLDIPKDEFWDAYYSLARSLEIEWTQNQKNIVALYAIEFVKECVSKKDFLPALLNEDEPFHSENRLRYSILFLAIHAFDNFANKLSDEYINVMNNIWTTLTSKKSKDITSIDIRIMLLQILKKHITNEKTLLIIDKWLGNNTPLNANVVNLTSYDQTTLLLKKYSDEILFMSILIRCKTKEDAIKTAMQKLNITKNSDINNFDFRNNTANIGVLLLTLRSDIEPLDILNVLDDQYLLQTKYVLLAWEYIMLIRKLENNKPVTKEQIDQLKSIGTKLNLEWRSQSVLPPLTDKTDINRICIPKIEKLINENQNNKQTAKTEQDKKPITQTNTESNIHQEKNIQESDEDVTIIRPEDQGEDFSLLDNAENFKRLTTAENKFERWKAAKVLGTRFIDGKFKPTQDEQNKINEYVAFLLTQFNTKNPGDAGDASDQLLRLWGLAIPGLFQGLKNKDQIIWNAALKRLVIFRNENIVG
ncbi:MAG: hypothetical protein LBC74_15925, partial [Planctomycetaceae bacterium]|nr:hypothetical protein [Planctomycetaceae bacterium]